MNHTDFYTLTPLQQGMLFHSLYAPQSDVYIRQMIYTLREALDAIAFRRAWERVVQRHPSLRMSIRWEGLAEPIQEIHGLVGLPFEEQDWRDGADEERHQRFEDFLRLDRQRGIQVKDAPLFRLTLLRFADNDYRLIWTFHHLISDGDSDVLILKEVFAFYEAFAGGHDLEFEQPRTYKEHVEWLERQDLSKAETFWRHTLGTPSLPTPLLVDESNEVGGDDGVGDLSVTLPLSLTSALRSLGQQHELTLNTLVQGAWALLLSRYSGEEYVVFGALRACRRSALDGNGAEAIVGPFVNTLPLCVHVPADAQVLPWLKELREQWIAMREYEHTPLLKIQEWMGLSQGRRLFDSLVSFSNRQMNSTLQAQGGKWLKRELRSITARTNYPFTMTAYGEESLLLTVKYHRATFREATIRRMLEQFERVLASVVEHPMARLSAVRVLGEQERRQLVQEWNDTKQEYEATVCIQEAFEAQVARSPAVPAVVWGAERVSYAELNERANQLGHYLQRAGVGPEVRVGLWLERSIEMVVGVLAVLKAGGAYVPLDPQHPAERVAFMVRDAGLKVVLQGSERALPGELEAVVINLAQARESIAREPVTNVVSGAVAENLAYVIYTSGSTGKPKGVLIEHRSALNLSRALQQRVYQGYAERPLRVSVNAPLTFDASVKQLLTLLFGGTLYPVPEAVRVDSEALLAFVAEQELQVLDCTPSQLTTLIAAWGKAESYCPAVLLVGGEAIERVLWQQLQELERLDSYNVYGPTECTVDATISRIRESGARPNIGRPVANTQVYLLDRQGALAPLGAAGELHIGGAGVGRGYLERAALTATRFIPNRFSAVGGERLYRTGDLARYGANGSLEFLGRLDQQVKVRGYRIELGEVETELNQHPAIRETIVLVRPNAAGLTRLVAYLTLLPDQSVTRSELRAHLKKRLPDYMIPSTFMFLDALPLSHNGKVDHKALPLPPEADVESIFVAPRTPLEQVLVDVWKEVLKVDRIGVHDSFFELGGHSLLATQAVSRLRQILRVELPLRSLFEMPCVADLAEQLIRDEAVPGQISTTAGLHIKIGNMSADEVQAMLHSKKRPEGNGYGFEASN